MYLRSCVTVLELMVVSLCHMPSLIPPIPHGVLQGVYEPGKRHWLKVKKDYLQGGAMADTADLIVLGAYYGTGNKGATSLIPRPCSLGMRLTGCY